jgi:ATP-dependent DNA helicase DinG
MKKDQLYAVVDIEATGASIGRDERMIQFACILVRNGDIIQSFDTFVNPSRKVSRTIRDLTGITTQDLATAPYFEDIAHVIRHLLEDTIFVAHNVGFDFQFLNECLERAGSEPLSIPAVDTVELAQILYPSEDSYQLKELTASLGYKLEQAHNALSDAEATVFLLNKLDDKIRSLPLITIESLTDLSPSTTAETALFFRDALDDMLKNPCDLSDSLMIVGDMAIKKPISPTVQEQYRKQPVYPYNEEEKRSVLSHIGLDWRSGQSEMMNTLFNYLKKDTPNYTQLIEAAPGSGKTYGYLFPSYYLASKENKIIISTYTKILQKQLSADIIPVLNQKMPFSKAVAVAKSESHYLSLSAFYRKWKNTAATDTEAIFCMKILVWLTETTEGDLEEIGSGAHMAHAFWKDIRPSERLTPLPVFESYEFLHRRNRRLEESAIIIANHAYLLADWKKAQPIIQSGNVIIDEAHHLPDVIDQSATLSLRVSSLVKDLKQIGSIDKEDSILNQLDAAADSPVKDYQIRSLESAAHILNEEWQEWSDSWIARIRQSDDYSDTVVEWKDHKIDLNALSVGIKKDNKRLKAMIDEMIYMGNQILELLESESEALSKEIKRLSSRLQLVIDRTQHLSEILTEMFFRQEKDSLTGIRFYSPSPWNTLTFYQYNHGSRELLHNRLHAVNHLVLTSSTLSVKGSTSYIQQALGLEQAEFSRFDSVYDYQKQGRLFVPDQQTAVGHLKRGAYASDLAGQLEDILKQTSENTLILFRSQETIQAVYQLLKNRPTLNRKTILAQNISGTPLKIAKQVKKAREVVVLGADSFWEGVDFPEDELKLVILTRLPFDSPDMPMVKHRHQLLSEQGKNPFVHDLLPRAVMKFKQGIGRLIRSVHDKGIWIVLDRRIIDSSYGSAFTDSLPEELVLEEYPLDKIIDETRTFFRQTENKD